MAVDGHDRRIVAFQGERGAYSEAAVIGFCEEIVELLPCTSFEAVFDAVTGGAADLGVIPVENSLAGSIHRNYDLLLRYSLPIVGEVQVRVAHELIVLPGVAMADVRRVYSHPQALAQCEGSLTVLLPEAERVATYDTAGSVKMLQDQGIRDGAAIASHRAAEIYGMSVLKTGLEDNAENYTRFLVLAREPVSPQEEAKTSIVYSMDNRPGALFRSLAVFALRDIDLTKIESRPLQGKPWEYFFYVDFVGSIDDAPAKNALRHLEELATFLRVLGCYPRAV